MAGEETEPEKRRPWVAAFSGRPWLLSATAVVWGFALLLLGMVLGGGGQEHNTLIVGMIAAAVALGQLNVARRRHEEQTKADLRRHDAQTKADFQRRITESFAKATEQLGSAELQVRLGGIYTLERIARESVDDYWTVMEMLTAFVRERGRWQEPDDPASAREQKSARPEFFERRPLPRAADRHRGRPDRDTAARGRKPCA